ncbi:porin [Tateyamaria sp. SN3-11]|uniref:porin n=1 Tax=Tateyamaria sp. SN3-11 TaxID=3092147 RepID=UPI0039EB7D9F
MKLPIIQRSRRLKSMGDLPLLTSTTVLILVSLLLLPSHASAQSTNGPEWDFYGHLNLGIINVDDGFENNTSLSDNDNSNSRVGLIFKQGLRNGGEFRFHFETAVGLTGSSSLNGGDNDLDLRYRRTELRKFEIIYQTPKIGTFSFGQGSIATDGIAQSDFSGTALIAYSSVEDQAGSQQFRLSDGTLSNVTVRNAFSAFDGARRFRVRYDTPKYKGFGLAVSGGREVLTSGNDNEFYDVGLTYDRDYGAYKIAGRLGYSIRGSSEELLLGSAAVLHEPTGLSLSVAAGRQQEGDANYGYIKAGLQRDWFKFGRTHLSVDYYSGDSFGVAGSSSSSAGVSVVQKVDRANLEIFASYRTFEYDAVGSDFEDLDVTFVGARWRF